MNTSALLESVSPAARARSARRYGFDFDAALHDERLVYLYYKPTFLHSLSLTTDHAAMFAELRRLAGDIRRLALLSADPIFNLKGEYLAVASVSSLVAGAGGLDFTVLGTFVPGPIGLFRRDALLAAGGYDERRETFAEDAELTVRLIGRGWRVVGDTSMIARTQTPTDLFSLLRQRYRWKRGLFQAFDANVLPLLLIQMAASAASRSAAPDGA